LIPVLSNYEILEWFKFSQGLTKEELRQMIIHIPVIVKYKFKKQTKKQA
jgi:hypothetical protein